MPQFPSAEWAEEFRRALNANPEYRSAATAWEDDILLLVDRDGASLSAPGVLLDLYHGECRSARYVPEATKVRAEFVFRGPRSEWDRLLSHQLDPVRAITGGAVQLWGNLAKVLRFTRAAKELIETASRIPSSP